KVPLWMVHVWDVPTAHTWDTAAISGVHDRWKEIASRRVHEIAERWHDKYPDVDLHEKIRQSHPVLGLLDACVATDAQLLVVGGHRHNRVSGMLVGSVGAGVLPPPPSPAPFVVEGGGSADDLHVVDYAMQEAQRSGTGLVLARAYRGYGTS